MDKYFFYDKKHKAWHYRTPLKCFINPILRKLQFWTNKPYVIYSKCDFVNDILNSVKDELANYIDYYISTGDGDEDGEDRLELEMDERDVKLNGHRRRF